MELKKHLTPKGFGEQLIYASLESMLGQAPPIVVLELCCLFLQDDFLRICASFCLCALYGRLRVSDCNRLSHGKVIGEYFE